MHHNIISKIFDDLLEVKCSIMEIRSKISSLSIEERKEKLDHKLNPLEKKEYDKLLEEIDFWDNGVGKENMSPEQIKEIDGLREQLFKYDKRIYDGYRLDKNMDNVPSYNLDDYAGDTFTEMYDNQIKAHEQAQIDFQNENLEINPLGVLSLQKYFGDEYRHINGELNPKYQSQYLNGGYWENLSSDEKEIYHIANQVYVKQIDSIIDESPGLVENTILYHGTNDTNLVDIHTRIGDKLNLKGYISTSFNEEVGKGYGSMPDCFVIRFLAPKGTKGICANTNGLTREPAEHEYLLGQGNKGVVADIDYSGKPPSMTVLLE